jgi:Cd2+/Zn2+-exporting ATPase
MEGSLMHDIARDEAGVPVPAPAAPSRTYAPFEIFIERYQAFITPLICLVLSIWAWVVGEHTAVGTNLSLAAVALAGYPILRNSVVSTITHRKLNAEVLVSIALIASVWVGEYVAGAMVALMMNIGELLEDLTIAHTGRAIHTLMNLEPETARIIRNGHEIEVGIDAVVVGDIAVVRPGEKISVDGEIVDGRGEVDQAPITGESMPVTKEPGDQVFGGTVNQLGALRVQVARVGGETTLARIIQLVQKAQAEKPPIERIADRFAAWFTPVMLTLAALVWGITGEVLRAVTVLVVACPCALVIATPTAVVAGIGNAARKGILVKGGAVLETISRLSVFAFDKTGTLTFGKPMVRSVKAFEEFSSDEIIRLAATAEKLSGHPLAQAVLDHAGQQNLTYEPPDETQVIVGRGVRAQKGGREILVGNQALFAEEKMALTGQAHDFVHETAKSGATAILVAVDGHIAGGLGIADTLRPQVRTTVDDLRSLGIGRIVMLTGDAQNMALAAMDDAGLDEIAADLMPDQKLAYIQDLRATGEIVAMVGDGINDAPALVEADVGIAMGSIGTDTAIEAADIALTTDDLDRVSEAIALSRQTIRVIKQSFVISIGINVLALILAGTGGIGPIAGAIIHNIGSVIVVGNSSRLIGYRFKKSSPSRFHSDG